MRSVFAIFERPQVRALASRAPRLWEEIFREFEPSSVDEELLKEEWIYLCTRMGIDWRRARSGDRLSTLFPKRWWSMSLSNELDDLEHDLFSSLGPSDVSFLPDTLGALTAFVAERRQHSKLPT